MCEYCHKEPCLCGMAYKDLDANRVAKLLYVIQQNTKQQLPDLRIRIGNTDLDTWILTNNISTGTDAKSVIDDLSASAFPDAYKKLLVNHGKSLRDFVNELAENWDELSFPFIMVLYRLYHITESTVAFHLARMTVNHMRSELVAKVFEDAVSANTEAIAYEPGALSRCLIEAQKVRSKKPEELEREAHAVAMISFIANIMESRDVKTIIDNAVFYMQTIIFPDLKDRNREVRRYREEGITRKMVDDYLDGDINLSRELSRLDFRTAWVL